MATDKKTEEKRVGTGLAGPGRPKGSPNKATASIKAAFKEAFEELGGATALAEWAKDNQTEFYRLASKLIPTELTGKDGGAIRTENAHGIDVREAPESVLKWLATRKVEE